VTISWTSLNLNDQKMAEWLAGCGSDLIQPT
jgi:hypothetical protein